MTEQAQEKIISPGFTVEGFSLKDEAGKTVDLKAVSGKNGVVVGFMHGTYCAHCMQQLRRSNRFARQLAEYDVKLVWVLRDEPAHIHAFRLAALDALEFDLLPDIDPSVAHAFRVPEELTKLQAAPYIFFVDANEVVQYLEKKDNPHAPADVDALLAAIRKVCIVDDHEADAATKKTSA